MRAISRSLLAGLVVFGGAAVFVACSKGGGGGDAGVPLTPTSIEKVTADAMVVSPGSTAGAPAVRLTRDGSPVTGATVTCTAAGGGQIASSTATSGLDGVASCGPWTVSAARGLNTLTVAAAGLRPVLFAAMAGASSSDVSVELGAPRKGAPVGDSFVPSVTVRSTYGIATVEAQAGTAKALLANQGGTLWAGTLSVAGQPSGELAVVVTATDHYGATSDAVVVCRLDRPPVLTVVSPRDGDLATPTANVEVRCEDAEGPCNVDVGFASSAVHGVAPFSTLLDLSASTGTEVTIAFVVSDSSGQTARATRTVTVEPSRHLTLVRTVGGNVLDTDGTRTVFIDPTSTVVDATGLGTISATLSLLDGSGAVTTARFAVPSFAPPTCEASSAGTPLEERAASASIQGVSGTLTSSAFLVSIPYYQYSHNGGPGSWPCRRVLEWKDGVVTDLGAVRYSGGVSVATDLAAWARWAPSGYELLMRELASGADTRFAPEVTARAGLDVAANGDLVYSDGSNVFRYRAGATSPVTSATAHAAAIQPRTDGAAVAYQMGSDLVVWRDGVERGLGTLPVWRPGIESGLWNVPDREVPYLVRDGWVAYDRSSGGQFQVWRSAASGDEQVTYFSSSSWVEALGDGGAIALRTDGGGRSISVPGAALAPVGTSLGRPVFRNGKLLVLLGRHVLAYVP